MSIHTIKKGMLALICDYPRMLLSSAIGGNLLGWMDVREARSEKLGFHTFWRICCNSVNDGEGPQRAHTITPFNNSAVTRRNGT